MSIFKRKKTTLEDQLSEARGKIAELEGSVTQGSTRDQLTSMLLTLRAFRTQLELDVERSHRYRRPLTIAVIDIDGFRRINEDHGYETGDMILVAVGELIAERSRTNDLACRISGDEFALLLPETEARDAVPAIERTVAEIEQLETPAGKLSISGGITLLQPDQNSGDLLAVARGALERARAQGGGSLYAELGEGFTAASPAGTGPVSSPEAGGDAAGPAGVPSAPRSSNDDSSQRPVAASGDVPDTEDSSGPPTPADGQSTVEDETAASPGSEDDPPADGSGDSAASDRPAEGASEPAGSASGVAATGDPSAEAGAATADSAEIAPLAEAAIDVGRALGIQEAELGLLHRAALMRLGPGALPQDMVTYLESTKPEALPALSGDPATAGRLIAEAGGLEFEATAIGSIAERWDGKGSPQGLSGDSIPLTARVMAVCEAYEGYVRPEPDGPGMERTDAVTAIARGSGSSFDPKVVDAFISRTFRRARTRS